MKLGEVNSEFYMLNPKLTGKEYTIQFATVINAHIIHKEFTNQEAHGATSITWATMILYERSKDIVQYGPSEE